MMVGEVIKTIPIIRFIRPWADKNPFNMAAFFLLDRIIVNSPFNNRKAPIIIITVLIVNPGKNRNTLPIKTAEIPRESEFFEFVTNKFPINTNCER